MSRATRLLSEKEYKKFLASMPIVCVDVVLRRKNSFLLLRRANRPARGRWWFPGGRILKNEKIAQAARRKILEETGIRGARMIRSLGAEETFFPDSAFGTSTHTVNAVVLMQVRGKMQKISRDMQSSDAQWFSRIRQSWPSYVRRMLRLAGFK